MGCRRVMRVLGAACAFAAVGLLAGCFLLPNDPPVAAFTANPTEGSAPLSVSFDASESYDPDGFVRSYQWSFGDGAVGTGMVVTHTYAAAGTYTAELTVEDQRQASGSTSQSITVRSGTNYAIIIGIANYAPPTPQLNYTDDDAVALRDRLQTLPGWDSSHILLLLNQDATTTNFRYALDALSNLSADDLVLIFFSGHGNYYVDLSGDEADGYDEAILFYDTALLDDTFALLVDQLPVRRLAIFIDACYSGGQLDSRDASRSRLDTGLVEDVDRLEALAQKDLDRVSKQLVAVTASRFDQTSWELGSLRHGIFTYALLEALNGWADAGGDGDGQTSVEECYAYLAPRVQGIAASVGETENPQMLDLCPGELEFAGVP